MRLVSVKKWDWSEFFRACWAWFRVSTGVDMTGQTWFMSRRDKSIVSVEEDMMCLSPLKWKWSHAHQNKYPHKIKFFLRHSSSRSRFFCSVWQIHLYLNLKSQHEQKIWVLDILWLLNATGYLTTFKNDQIVYI